MSMLNRHKRAEDKGFKDFVKSLETTPLEKREIIFKVGISEDPIYMRSIKENILTMDKICQLSTDEWKDVISLTPNAPAMLAKALYKTDHEYSIKDNFPERFKKQFEEEKELISELPLSAQEVAQFRIFSLVRELQASGKVTTIKWELPSQEVITGREVNMDHGKWRNTYEDGSPESEGSLIDFKKHGVWTFYHKNGQQLAQGKYQRGKKEGKWIFWFANGKELAIGEYSQDKRHGDWVEFNKEGQAERINYRFGVREGVKEEIKAEDPIDGFEENSEKIIK